MMEFVKNFSYKFPKGLFVINQNDCDAFIAQKSEHFKKHENFSNKQEWLNLFQEITDMIKYDFVNSTFDFTELADTVGFNSNNMQHNMILFYDIAYILGRICFNIFNYDKNKLENAEGDEGAAISTSQMFKIAYSELSNSKATEDTKPAYGATLILATLLEKELKLKFKISCMQKCLKKLDINILQSNTVINDPIDEDLINYLKKQYNDDNSVVVNHKYNSVEATTNLAYDLFSRHNSIDSSIDDIDRILKNEITLNQALRNNTFKNLCEPPIYEIMCYLFGTKELNLRNNLAHCNFTYINYYNKNVTALLYILFVIISQDFYLK